MRSDENMSDVWARVSASFDPTTQKRLATVLVASGADAQKRAMRNAFLGQVDFPA